MRKLSDAAFEKLCTALELRPKAKSNATHWFNFGYYLHIDFGRYAESEQAYREAIRLDPNYAAPWNGLGTLLLDHLARYAESEQAYREAIRLDPKLAWSWNNLGNLLQDHLARYAESEQAYREAIRLDPNKAVPWNNLGNLLMDHLARYAESEQAFRQAIRLDPNFAWPWNGLGNLLQDFLGRHDEAIDAYRRSLDIDTHNDSPRHNLVFLLRDLRHEHADARSVLQELQEPEKWRDSQALHEALFAAYEQDWPNATVALKLALSVIGGRLPASTRDDWFRASAVLLHLGFGARLVEVLQESGADVELLPWFAAVQAHALEDKRHLLNLPVEARPVAEQIFDQIERRRKQLS